MDTRLVWFYFSESQRCKHGVAWEWLLRTACQMGIGGASVFRAKAGFGRHRKLRDLKFFEVVSPLGVRVEFVVPEHQAAKLIELVAEERLEVPYAIVPVVAGVTSPAVVHGAKAE